MRLRSSQTVASVGACARLLAALCCAALVATSPVCPPGQGLPFHGATQCELCPFGTFNPGTATGACKQCPEGLVTNKMGAIACGCPPGTGVPVNDARGRCAPCASGTYSPGGTLSPCIRCLGGPNMQTPAKATRQNQCTCPPGYGGTYDNPTLCQLCPIGSFSDTLRDVSAVPGMPPRYGKGAPACCSAPLLQKCISCCPEGQDDCTLTTLQPGSTSYDNCTLVATETSGYCCGVAASGTPGSTPECRIPVPRPIQGLPANALRRRGNSSRSIIGSGEPLSLAAPVTPGQSASSSSRGSNDGGGAGDGASEQQAGGRSIWDVPAAGPDPDWDGAVEAGGASAFTSPAPPAGWWGELQLPPRGDAGRRLLNICDANPRQALGDPWASGINRATVALVPYWADTRRGSACPFNSNFVRFGLCTGSQIAPYMVLTSARCLDPSPWLQRWPSLCAGLQLQGVVACYQWNRTAGAVLCPEGINFVPAVGVTPDDTWQQPGDPNDHAIVFLNSPRLGPYYEYNYIENLRPGNALASYASRSYIGDGTIRLGPGLEPIKTCGCVRCDRNATCGLGVSGPALGPLTGDAVRQGNGAANARLEACAPGGDGACMTTLVRGASSAACCVGTFSYALRPPGLDAVCVSSCSNYWSTISASSPLSRLWARVAYPLPPPLEP